MSRIHENNRPVKDIDHTDHGRPSNHANPHEHTWDPNKTGGTPSRNKISRPVQIGGK